MNDPKQKGTWGTALALLLSAVAIAAAAYTFEAHRSWRADLARLEGLAESTGITARRPALVGQLGREGDSTRASLRLARSLLADELDRRWVEELPEEEREAERERGLDRLDAAFDLGNAVLAERPQSWEALTVVGGSNYLRFSRRRDARLGREELWLEPLHAAHRLAPTQHEPLRLLAATYLGNWSVLSTEEKGDAIDVLREAFVDPLSFDLLATSWLRVAPSLSQALAIVPDRPAQWGQLQRYFRRIGDWERCAMATERLEAARGRLIEERLLEARERLRGGDLRVAVERLRWIGGAAVPDAAHVAHIEEAVALLPPGSVREADTPWLAAWLRWSLDRYLEGSALPLDRGTVRRMAALSSHLPGPLQAWGLAAGGDQEGAARIEPERLDAAGGEWRPYSLAKARAHFEEGRVREAQSLLEAIPPAEPPAIVETYLRAQVAAAARGDGDAQTRPQLAGLEAEAWSPDAWRRATREATLDLLPARSADGVELRLYVAGQASGILTVFWDGSKVATLPTTKGRIVRIDRSVKLRPHRLAIRTDRREAIVTAEVSLLPRSP